MRFDPFQWSECEVGKTYPSPEGNLTIRASGLGALFVICDGVEALVGFGHSFDVDLVEPFEFRFEGKGLRSFVKSPLRVYHESDDENWANADRLPHESGSMQEVRRALRLHKLEMRDENLRFREETARLVAEREAALATIAAIPEAGDPPPAKAGEVATPPDGGAAAAAVTVAPDAPSKAS